MSANGFKKAPTSNLPDLLRRSAQAHEISTEPDAESLLCGEAATHFPEARNRRKEDDPEDEARRLRAILHALDKGQPFPEGGVEEDQKDIIASYYRQF